MRSKKLFLSSILVFALLVFGFVDLIEASLTTWSRTYGGKGHERAYSLVATSDGGYAIAGSTSSFGAGSSDFWLIKTDALGIVEWDRTYGGTSYEHTMSLVATADGGYALAGDTYSFGAGNADWWLVKTDGAGNVEWNRTYGGIYYEFAYSLVETSDGGYTIAGSTTSFSVGGRDDDFWLIKTDEFGDVEWNRTYGGTEYGGARSLVVTSDGGYVIAGGTLLVKTDAVGNMKWNQTYTNCYIRCIIQTSDGGYALAGDANDDFWLGKTDASGNLQWNRTYKQEGNDWAESLVESSNGGYVLVGIKNFANSFLLTWEEGDFFLIKTDSSGNLEWNRTYGEDSVAWAHSMVQTSDGGYAIAGEKSGDFWLIKTDKYGIIPEWYPPYICVDSPQNTTYATDNVSLNFTVNEEASWMGYSLDGQSNVTLIENTLNLTELVNGSHTLTVYATDTADNTAASETISFTIAKKDETPTSWTTTAIAIAAVAATAAALLIIYTKTKKNRKK